MKLIRRIRVLGALLLLGLSSRGVRADGGAIRLFEAKGPYVITIFTASEPVQDGPMDVSVMVQRRDSSEAILDANVDLMFTPPAELTVIPIEQMCGQFGKALMSPSSDMQMTEFTVPATHKQASNKLLYAASIKFGATGNWRLQVSIERGSEVVKVGCVIPVGSPPRRLTGLIPYLVLPPLMVSLFVINQRLRPQSLVKRL
jgi:hypothetical protein